MTTGPTKTTNDGRTIVVAIGASAGGLRPLQELFAQLPCDLNMSFVVVQHLSPDFESMMDKLLAKCTDMPIQIIADGMKLEPRTIYLNPPNFDVAVVDDGFVLTYFDEDELKLPINSMFHSIANRYGVDSVGVVLSGTGSDGASGIQTISQMAGLTIAQSLETAQFDGMPRSAMATDVVDYVMAPSEIATLLAEHSVQPVARPNDTSASDTSHLSGVQLIFSLLSASYGINFAHYKPTTVARRIDRRLKLSRHSSLDDYSKVLREDPRELDLLYHDLLIGVTKFFRDVEAFDLLGDELDLIIEQLPAKEQLRVWSVGCASGEESYSLAMMLVELYEARGLEPNFKVFATDVHDQILEFAARGVYISEVIDGLSPERQAKFFAPHGDDRIKVIPRLRNHLVFATQNVVSDPPFTRMNLVVCRNLLIYLQDNAQSSAISGFRFALQDRGLMMLGPSETVGKMSPGFDVINKDWRLFRKNQVPVSKLPVAGKASKRSAVSRDASTLSLVEAETRSVRVPALAQLLLSDLLPAAVLVDSKRNILHSYGIASSYLQNGNQNIEGNLLKFFPNETSSDIAAVVLQATNQLGTEFVVQNLETSIDGNSVAFDLTAKSFAVAPGDPPVTLIQFKSLLEGKAELTDEEPEDGSVAEKGLWSELANTRARLGSTIQQMETNNEEMQAANEEIIASNEELQATNEELQSVNEELHTVNLEHQKKVLELEEMTDDFNNLFNSTDVGSILLDEELRIRKFTKAAKKYFRLMDHDIGRSLTNFASQVVIDDLPGTILQSDRIGKSLFFVRERS